MAEPVEKTKEAAKRVYHYVTCVEDDFAPPCIKRGFIEATDPRAALEKVINEYNAGDPYNPLSEVAIAELTSDNRVPEGNETVVARYLSAEVATKARGRKFEEAVYEVYK